jgi:hypothetical protein
VTGSELALLRAQLELFGSQGWRLDAADEQGLLASRRGRVEVWLSAETGDELLEKVSRFENTRSYK